MRYALFGLFVILVACKKPTAEIAPVEAGAPAATASAAEAPSAAPVASTPTKYTFAKQTDFLSRWTIDIPTSFTKKAVENPCTDSGCSELKTAFEGDGLDIQIDDASAEPPLTKEAVAKQAGGGKIIGEKTLPRGYWIVASTAGTHVFVQEIEGYAGPVRLVVKGPEARKTEIENLIAHLSASWNVFEKKPARTCKPLPWADGGASKATALDFGGKLAVGHGFNASMVDEKPYILETDEAWCDSAGKPCWEFQAYALDNKPPLKALVGKHVLLTGKVEPQETAHHHRPIMLEVEKAAVQ